METIKEDEKKQEEITPQGSLSRVYRSVDPNVSPLEIKTQQMDNQKHSLTNRLKLAMQEAGFANKLIRIFVFFDYFLILEQFFVNNEIPSELNADYIELMKEEFKKRIEEDSDYVKNKYKNLEAFLQE